MDNIDQMCNITTDNRKVDLEDLRKGVNYFENTSYETVSQMFKGMYDKYKTLQKVGDVLGLSKQSVYKYMKDLNIPRGSKGHRYPSPSLKAILLLGDVSNMTSKDICKYTGFSISRIGMLLLKENIRYKRILKKGK